LVKSAVLARLSGGVRTIGFTRPHLREPLAGFFYTEAHEPGPRPHVVFRNLHLLGAVGVQDETARFPLEVPRTRAVDTVGERLGSGAYVLINPGAAWPNKRWPPDRFGALASAVRERTG